VWAVSAIETRKLPLGVVKYWGDFVAEFSMFSGLAMTNSLKSNPSKLASNERMPM